MLQQGASPQAAPQPPVRLTPRHSYYQLSGTLTLVQYKEVEELGLLVDKDDQVRGACWDWCSLVRWGGQGWHSLGGCFGALECSLWQDPAVTGSEGGYWAGTRWLRRSGALGWQGSNSSPHVLVGVPAVTGYRCLRNGHLGALGGRAMNWCVRLPGGPLLSMLCTTSAPQIAQGPLQLSTRPWPAC